MAYTITEQDDAISKVGPEDSDTYLNSKYLNGWTREQMQPMGYVRATAALSGYAMPMWTYNYSDHSIYEDRSIVFLVANAYAEEFAILKVDLRNTKEDGSMQITGTLEILLQSTRNDLSRNSGTPGFSLYIQPNTGDVQLWCNTRAQWKCYSTTILKKLAGCQELSSIGTLLCKSYTEAPTMPDDTYIVMYPKFSGYAGRAYEAERYVEGGAIHSGIKTALTRIQDIYVNIGNILISKGVIKKADYIETLPSYCKTIIVNEGSLVDDPTES